MKVIVYSAMRRWARMEALAMRWTPIGIALLVFAVVSAANADPRETCVEGFDPEEIVIACTEIVNSSWATEAQL
jgi:hypothetical protein